MCGWVRLAGEGKGCRLSRSRLDLGSISPPEERTSCSTPRATAERLSREAGGKSRGSESSYASGVRSAGSKYSPNSSSSTHRRRNPSPPPPPPASGGCGSAAALHLTVPPEDKEALGVVDEDPVAALTHRESWRRSVLLSGGSGCRAVSAAVRPLCAVGLSGSCQAVTLGPDSDGSPLMSGSAVRLSDTCCQAVRESAADAVRLSGTVRRCPGVAVRLSDQGSV